MANDSVAETIGKLVQYIAGKFLRGEVQLGDLIGLSDKEIDAIFLTGHFLYSYGRYQDSLSIFSVLTLYKPFTSRYWRAAGAANQALKQYPEAILAFDMAIGTNINDVVSYTYRGESKLYAGDQKGGVEDLKQAVLLGGANQEFRQWTKRADALLKVRQMNT